MASDPSLLAAGLRLAADPWAWFLPGSLALGGGFGLLLRSAAVARRSDSRKGVNGDSHGGRPGDSHGAKPGDSHSKAARLSAWGLLLLALGTAAGIGLAVFAGREDFRSGGPGLRPWVIAAGLSLILGWLVGLFPRAAGLPLLAITLSGTVILWLALEGWLPASAPREIAVLTPFTLNEGGSGAGARAELAVLERDTVPLIQPVEIRGGEAGLVIERLELEGPLRLLRGSSFYRVTGLLGAGRAIAPAFAPRSGLVDRILPLLPEGDPAAAAELPLARHWREASEIQKLAVLVPLHFVLDPGAERGSGLELLASPNY